MPFLPPEDSKMTFLPMSSSSSHSLFFFPYRKQQSPTPSLFFFSSRSSSSFQTQFNTFTLHFLLLINVFLFLILKKCVLQIVKMQRRHQIETLNSATEAKLRRPTLEKDGRPEVVQNYGSCVCVQTYNFCYKLF